MKKVLLLLTAFLATVGLNAQILDSLRVGSPQVTYEILAHSNYEDFGANVYGEQLLFVSSRETNILSKKYEFNNQKFFDLFLYDFKSKDVKRYGDALSSLESSKYHLGPSTLLADSMGIVLSRNYKIANANDEVNFYLVYENWKTGERYKMPYCTMDYSFQHPFYDAKTRRLYFSSNLPGGPGGYDIYFSEFLKDGSWGDPVLVEGVNGPRDDVFPTISKDGLLYFSRTVTKMGLDVFAFNFKSGQTTEMSAPFITSRDEFQLVALNKDSAVFSQSQRGRFNTDLVLAWIETDGLLQDFAVIAPVPANMDPWDYLAVVQSKWPNDDVWVGEQDGQPVVMIKGKRPESEAKGVRDAVVALGIPAELTKDPVNPLERPFDDFAVIAPVPSGQDPWSYLDEVKGKWPNDEVWVGEQDGKPVVMIKGRRPVNEAEGIRDAVIAAGIPAELTKDPVLPLERPIEVLHTVYPIACAIEQCFDDLDRIKNETGADSLWIGELNGRPVIVITTNKSRENAEKARLWAIGQGMSEAYLTPYLPTPIERPVGINYSTIAGVFDNPSGAQKQLVKVSIWAPEAFISLYKGKYYVVSADYQPKAPALVSKSFAVDHGVKDAWLLPEKLYPLVLPDLQGSPDLIVYFRFDKYDVMDKYQKQIDDVMAQLPEGVERVYMVGHTDSRGTNAYNDVLSRNRVNAVAEYMTAKYPKFTAAKELDSRGENELTNKCGDGQECDEYAHFLNRRVEVWFY